MKEKLKVILKRAGIALLFLCAFVVMIDFWQERSLKRPLSEIRDAFRRSPSIPKIIISEPMEDELIKSPLSVKGYASKAWFFDNGFPVVLTDSKGKIVSTAIAIMGTGDSDEMVPFEATLSFTSESKGKGVIRFTRNDKKNDEFAETYDLAIRFD